MKKRILATILVLCTLFGAVACGGDKPSETDPETVTSADPTESGTGSDTQGSTDVETDPPVVIVPDDIDLSKSGMTELNISTTIGGDGESSNTKHTYTYKAGEANFEINGATTEGTTVTFRKNSAGSMRFQQFFQDGTKANYQFKLHVSAKGPWIGWQSLFIGLRLPDAASDATTRSGIWLSVRGDEIGIRTGNWPGVSHVKINAEGVNFSTARMLYIEDDMETDVITISADNDGGEKVEIAIVKLENNTVNLYRPGESKPAASDKVELSIQKNGYMNIWMHQMTAPVYVTDFTATGVEAGKETEREGNMMNSRDVFADTWVSVDDEGRVTGTGNGEVNDKKVGIFYFLWHEPYNATNLPIYNHTEAYLTGGSALLIETLQKGQLGFSHYWGEPYFGYYRSTDEWVIRKHTYQLTAAGVDFIFCDVTNGVTFPDSYEAILRVWEQMRAEGQATPQIMFNCGLEGNETSGSFHDLWANLYSLGRYEDLWFKYDGKPMILISQDLMRVITPEQREFFTIRHSWAFSTGEWYTAVDGNNCWPWADVYPQGAGKSSSGEVEQMVVMSGFWANGANTSVLGRSYSYKNGGQPADSNFGFTLTESGSSGQGIAFQEQFDRALEVDPEIIMLTGWNEWWAGRWEAGLAIGQNIVNTWHVTNDDKWTKNYYVDCFSPEYSRDIEPMKGCYNDNYYYQMAQNIRQYKGSRVPLSVFGQKAIDMNGDASQWLSVGPEYRDAVGDTAHRNAYSYVGNLHYTNTSGRNDFKVCKVSMDGDRVYFYAECAEDITEATGTNWMNLYINVDGKQETGWYGYDYIINRSQDGKKCSIEKFVGNEWAFESAGNAEYVINGDTMVIKVSASALGLGSTFDFKWADNSVSDGDIMQFLDLGDTAPNDRFNYRFTTDAVEPVFPEVLTDDMIVLKAGSYNAFVGGEMLMLNNQSTKATFLGDENGLYVPKAFAEEKMGLDVSNAEIMNHYGVEYVDITTALASCGKIISRTESLLVLSDQAVSDDDMLILYRALY